ncbi:17120_t:CDS:2 [Entrophospora sp. SA101]|nr:21815_t:CDS:2 [Entrophospora sp. SA101]CAJ0865971.1 17120_t:CDS:2 [Entrophospora sp. SA101]
MNKLDDDINNTKKNLNADNIMSEVNSDVLDINIDLSLYANPANFDDFDYSSEEENINFKNKINLEQLNKLTIILKNKKLPADEYFQYLAIYKYFVNLNKDLGKIEASICAAGEVYNKNNKGSYKATCIRKWAMHWFKNEVLPKSMQGCHQKTKSLIDDEDVINGSLEFIRLSGGKTTPLEYKEFVNSKLLIENKKSISDNTSCIDCDGHEREDVISYHKIFLEKMKELEQYMPKFVGDEMVQLNPELPDEQNYIFLLLMMNHYYQE